MLYHGRQRYQLSQNSVIMETKILIGLICFMLGLLCGIKGGTQVYESDYYEQLKACKTGVAVTMVEDNLVFICK